MSKLPLVQRMTPLFAGLVMVVSLVALIPTPAAPSRRRNRSW